MEITGEILKIGEIQDVTESFKKREIILLLEKESDYPQKVKFEFGQVRVAVLDDYSEGQTVTVLFSLQGREWINKQGETVYFNTLKAWQIKVFGEAPAASENKKVVVKEVDVEEEVEGDIPF